MKQLQRAVCVTLLLIGFIGTGLSQRLYSDELFSTAEKTQFESTTLSKDVRAFVNALSTHSNLVHVEVFGHSKSGQDLQLVVMANPKISTPEEAIASGKPIVYVQGNIHAGEVEGKEASITLMREIAFEEKSYLLDNQIILFCPNFNPDGNDKLSENNRRNQEGSPKLAGERASGEGFDLNREGLKLEALEAKALVKNVLNKWDPDVLIDLHTDNGSWHGYIVSYAPSFQSAGESGPTQFAKTKIFPWITKDVNTRTGMDLWWHGYLRMSAKQPATFTGYSHQPRYITNYMGLRNKIGILSESFAHELFEQRYWGTYYLVESILRYTNQNADELNRTIDMAEENTLQTVRDEAGKMKKGVRYARTKEAEIKSILVRETETVETSSGRRSYKGTGKIYWKDSIYHYNSFEPTLLSTVPKAYYFSKDLPEIADKLREHGIQVSVLDQRIKVTGEEFQVQEFKKATRSRYPGHAPVTLEGEFKAKAKTFKKGDYQVQLEQKLAWVIFYLLEPQSDDGLVYWNYFDKALEGKEKGTYPIFKALQ